MKLHFPCMSRTQNTKNNVFKLVAFLLLSTLSLSQRSYTSLLQHVKLCVTIFCDLQFYRKLKYANLVEPNSILTLSYRVTRSWSLLKSVDFFLTQCEKSMFPSDLTFHLQNCRIQQKWHETHKICLWLERIRSSHKEFAYLLYNSTKNTWNSQDLAS